MGEIRAKVLLENVSDSALFKARHIGKESVRARDIEAVVDTGAVMMLLPQDVVDALGLEITGHYSALLANDETIVLPRASRLSLTICGRPMTTDCLVGPPGCEALIGQIVLEQLDLIPDPRLRTLTPRPESPLRPTLKMKELAFSGSVGLLQL